MPLLQGCTLKNTCWKRVYGPRMKSFAIAIDKREGWQGIEQNIIALEEENVTYEANAAIWTLGLPCT